MQMTVDKATQHMLFKTSNNDIENLAWLARKERADTINRYQEIYHWSVNECEEFLDNVTLAYDLLVKDSIPC